MRILVAGGTGKVGAAVVEALRGKHEVLVASRTSEYRVDVGDGASIDRLFGQVGTVDAVVSVLGSTPFPQFTDLTTDHFRAGIANKLLGQIDLVLRGRPFVADGGSFTLVSGILAQRAHPFRSRSIDCQRRARVLCARGSDGTAAGHPHQRGQPDGGHRSPRRVRRFLSRIRAGAGRRCCPGVREVGGRCSYGAHL